MTIQLMMGIHPFVASIEIDEIIITFQVSKFSMRKVNVVNYGYSI